jgi:predicted nucleic acid-binding protein
MIVIDASVALKWVFQEAGSREAVALRSEAMAAPDLLLIETANALWHQVNVGLISLHQAEQRWRAIADAPVDFSRSDVDLPEALRLAGEIDHPVYDCLYLALARRLRTVLVTADRRLYGRVERHDHLAASVRLLTS